jgi:hypothetical protein
MLNYLKTKFMAFIDIFKDKNEYNEKSIVGFLAFALLCVTATADLITGIMGKQLVVDPNIFNSLVIITLGSFGIAEAGKVFGGKKEKKYNEEEID